MKPIVFFLTFSLPCASLNLKVPIKSFRQQAKSVPQLGRERPWWKISLGFKLRDASHTWSCSFCESPLELFPVDCCPIKLMTRTKGLCWANKAAISLTLSLYCEKIITRVVTPLESAPLLSWNVWKCSRTISFSFINLGWLLNVALGLGTFMSARLLGENCENRRLSLALLSIGGSISSRSSSMSCENS